MRLVPDHNKTVIVWGNFLRVALIHGVALVLGGLLYTPAGLVFSLMSAFFFGLAQEIFHHRLLTHRSFQCAKWLEYLGTSIGTLSWHGAFAGPLQQVALDRIHHEHADTDLDPHAPHKGVFFAVVGWLWKVPFGLSRRDLYRRYAPDVAEDRFHCWLDSRAEMLQLLWGTSLLGAGTLWPWLLGGEPDPVNGLRFLVFGVFVRALINLYLGNLVSVLNHSPHFRARHQAHHRYQQYLQARHPWWKVMARLGLVWNVLSLESPALTEYGRSRTTRS
jgi:stearoyl-CoA desaturase (delta-9 desaturase)